MHWDAWFRRRRWERRMDAELPFHLACQVEEYMSRGLSLRQVLVGVEMALSACWPPS